MISYIRNRIEPFMFDKKDKDNVCYCETCQHKTASECIEIQCSCCLEADKIRLEHPVLSEDDLSPEEKERRESEEHADEENLRKQEMYTWISNA